METKEQTSQAKGAAKSKDREITVVVEARKLYPEQPLKPNVDKHVALVDDEGFESEFGDPNSNFETIVFMEKKIKWSIEPSEVDSGYIVALDNVTHNPKPGNPQFFTRNPIPVRPDGTIRGKIRKDPDLPNKDDSYTIHLTITHNGIPKSFPVDPKLKINVQP